MSEPIIKPIRGGFAAMADRWAVHGATEEEAREKFREAEEMHARIEARARLAADPKAVIILYRNHRDEVRERTIIPERLWYGATEWHPEEQWLLTALDVEKNERRDFAMSGIREWRQEGVE